MFIVTLIFIVQYKGINESIAWHSDPYDVISKLIVKLVVLGALLDQFIAVFFKEKKQKRSNKDQLGLLIRLKQNQKDSIKKEIFKMRISNPEGLFKYEFKEEKEQIKEIEQTILESKMELDNLENQRSGYIRAVAFAIGLVIAISGVTILAEFVDLPRQESKVKLNHQLMYFLDIFFTAAVLSGGTSGINQFFKIIRESWKNNEEL